MFDLNKQEVREFCNQVFLEMEEILPYTWENRHKRNALLLERVNKHFGVSFEIAHSADVEKWRRYSREWASAHLWDVAPFVAMRACKTDEIALWDGEYPNRGKSQMSNSKPVFSKPVLKGAKNV